MSELVGGLLGWTGTTLAILGLVYSVYPYWPGRFRDRLTRGLAVGVASALAAAVSCMLAFATLTLLFDAMQVGVLHRLNSPVFFDTGLLLGITASVAIVGTIMAVTSGPGTRTSVSWTKNIVCAAVVALIAVVVRLPTVVAHSRLHVLLVIVLIVASFWTGAIGDWPVRRSGRSGPLIVWSAAVVGTIGVLSAFSLAGGAFTYGVSFLGEGLFLVVISLIGYTFCNRTRLSRPRGRDGHDQAVAGFSLWIVVGVTLGLLLPLAWHRTLHDATLDFAGVAIGLIVCMAHDYARQIIYASAVVVIARPPSNAEVPADPSSADSIPENRWRLKNFLARTLRAAMVSAVYLSVCFGMIVYAMYLIPGSFPSVIRSAPLGVFIVFVTLAIALVVGPTASVVGLLWGCAGLAWFTLRRLEARYFMIGGVLMGILGVLLAVRADWLAVSRWLLG